MTGLGCIFTTYIQRLRIERLSQNLVVDAKCRGNVYENFGCGTTNFLHVI